MHKNSEIVQKIMIAKANGTLFSFNLTYRINSLLEKFLFPLNPCHITYRLKGVYAIFQKTQNIGRIDLHSIITNKNFTDLSMVKSKATEFQDLQGKFSLRTTTLG